MKRSTLLRILAVCALLLAPAPIPAQAQAQITAHTFNVNSTLDTADATPGNCTCATSGSVCTLRAAVQEANACAGNDDIVLANNTTYTLGSMLTIDPVSPSDQTNISPTDPNGIKATINGNNGGFSAFQAVNGEINFTNIKIQNSDGIYVGTNADLYLYSVLLTGNTGGEFGDGDEHDGGGAIRNMSGNVTIIGSQIENNSSAGCGGAINNLGNLYIQQSTLANNSAYKGGAICHVGYYDGNPANTPHLTISFSRFTGNSATQSGGAIFLSGPNINNDAIVLNNSLIQGNDAQIGGGVYLGASYIDTIGGGMTILSTTLSGNVADYGAGMAVENRGNYGGRYEIYLENVTLSGNNALVHGGGVYMPATATIAISSSTITDNTADREGNHGGQGGGIYNDSETKSIRMENTLLAGNHDLTSGPFAMVAYDCQGNVDLQGYNLIGILQAGVCNLIGNTSTTLSGTTSAPLNPLLDVLDDLSSPPTHALLQGSPAIDRGDPAGCKNPDDTLIDYDARGESRQHGYACDIGAYESAFSAARIYLPAILR